MKTRLPGDGDEDGIDEPTLADQDKTTVAAGGDPEVTLADGAGAVDIRFAETLADSDPGRPAGNGYDEATLPDARCEESVAALTVDQDATLAIANAPATAARRPSPLIPGFEVYRELGRGGMGVVYHARRVLLNRPCALKMILAGEHADTEASVRFLAEAETVARLRHPNIVQIYEIGEHDGRTYLELEYADGGSLEKRLDGTPWPPRRAAALVEPLARAVAEAHRVGIVHRDLKPGNILLAADGTPKLGDFGLAKALGSDSGLTRTDSVLGSPSYMAPEQAEGHSRGVGPAADVYSLGAILYELLTGRVPFRGATVLQTLDQVKSAEPVPPSRMVPGTSRDLETICLKCLHKEPGRRYESADELAEDLRRMLAGESIRARRSGPVERTWRWCRRKPAQAAAIGLAALALVAVTALSTTLAVVQTRSNRRILAALSEARAQSTKLAAERGIALVEQRDGAGGLLWLARALATDPRDEAGLHHAIRANMARAAREQVTAPRAILETPGGGRIAAVAYSPDGKHAAVGHMGGSVRLWETATGRPLGPAFNTTDRGARLQTLAFTPDGAKLLVATAARKRGQAIAEGQVRAWDPAAGRPLAPPVAHPGVGAAISPDGKLLAALVGDTTVHLRDLATGALLGKPLVHDQDVSTVTFSPDGKTALTGEAPTNNSNQSRALLWNVATGGLVWVSERHPGWHIYDVAFSPDGKVVATAANDHKVRLFDAATGKATGTPLENPDQVNVVAFSPDGRTIAAGMAVVTAGGTERAEVRLWDRATGRTIGPDLPHEGGVMDVAFSPDGSALLSGGSDGTAYLWAPPEGDPVGRPLEGAVGEVTLAITPDGRTVLAGGFEQKAAPYDTATGRPSGPAIHHGKFVWRIALSPDGRTVATGSGLPASTNSSRPNYGDARLWDRATGRPIGQTMAHRTDRLQDLAFTPDGKALLTIDLHTVRFWDAATGSNLGIDFAAAPQPISAMALSPDGRRLVLADVESTLHLWELADMRTRVLRRAAHRGPLTELAFSPDGRYVATASWDKTARVWDASTGEPHGPLLRHDARVAAVAFSPDGLVVATGGDDRTVRLWDRATGTRIGAPIRLNAGAEALTFTPDGRTLAVATLDDTTLWDLPAPAGGDVPSLVLWAEALTGRTLDREGAVSPLGLAAWQQRRRSLEGSGYAPKPRPADAEARRELALADLSEAGGDWFAALWHLDRLIATRPGEGPLLLRRARVLGRAGRDDEAARELTRAIGRLDDPASLRELGQTLRKDDRDDEAATAFERAAERSADAAELAELAEQLADLGRWDKAAAALARSCERDRSKIEYRYQLALARLHLADLAGYRAVCKELLDDVGPNPPPARSNAITWPLALGPGAVADPAVPVRLADAAVAATAGIDKRAILNTLGGLLERAGRHDEAIRRLEEGIALGRDGGSPLDWAFLALACHHAGRPDDARRWSEKLAKWKPAGPQPFWDGVEVGILRDEVAAVLAKKAE